MRKVLASVILSAVLGCSLAFANTPTPPIKRFSQVTDSVFRGAEPPQEGIKYIAGLGVKAEIDLEGGAEEIQTEKAWDAPFGILLYSIPLSSFETPTDDEINQILSIMTTPANLPVFVHCKHGEDRTGLVIGLYRVLVQHWAPQDAYNEMLQQGFHPVFFPLDNYFRQRTGFRN